MDRKVKIDSDLKLSMFRVHIPEVKEEDIEDYVVILPESMKCNFDYTESDWLYFDEFTDVYIYAKRDTFDSVNYKGK